MNVTRVRSFQGALAALVLSVFLIPNSSHALFKNRWRHRDYARRAFNDLKNNCIKTLAPSTSVAALNGFINGCNSIEGRLRKNIDIANRNGSDRIQPGEMQTMNTALTMWSTKRSKLQQRIASGNL